ncbi:MAG: alpha/beta hydrolase [Nitrospinae bacterium]|nr:alpha/beta hydrolase [Nitrospinota bacterium]
MTRNRSLAGLLFFLFAASLFSSCTHLFYQPGKEQYFDPGKMGMVYQDAWIESAGGRKLHAWLFPSVGETPERGTIIQFHGNAENISSHFASLAWVTKRGYNFIAFDYSGYWNSDGEPGQKALNEDSLSALTYAYKFNQTRSQETGNKLSLSAYGQSLGGAVLLRALADYPLRGELNAVVIESSFYSYQTIAREKLGLSWITWLFQPLAYVLVSDEYAPEKVIGSLSGTRLLVIHGTDDKVVPIRHGRRIFELAKEPKTFWEVQGGRHIDSMTRHGKEYRDKLIAYLDEAGAK